MTPITRALAHSLIDEHFTDGSGDVAADYAQHIPVRVIAQMIGIPLEDEPKFTGWAVRTLQEGLQNLADLPEVFEEMTRSEEHTSELQSLMRISYAVCCLKKK